MGKNHRHKKQLKSEKAKVKFKAKSEKTKFLPKGGNITDVNFKVKAIVVPQQLKSTGGDELLSTRKLNVKELLKRVKHYNSNVKCEACDGLVEILISNPNLVFEQYLSELLRVVCGLVFDVEQKVRRAALKVIKIILENTSVQSITPFFGIISTHLRCAMTNIDRNVQEDSLLLMDLLLKHTPNLLAMNSNKIMSNFFALISKIKNESKTSRTVMMNLNSKLTSVKWRIKVLNRLQALFAAVIEYESARSGSVKLLQEENITFETSLKSTFPLYANWYSPSIVDETMYVSNINEKLLTNDSSSYADVLIPLLHETWLEVAPEINIQTISQDNTVLNAESATILTYVLNIFHLLLQFVQLSSGQPQMASIVSKRDSRQFINQILKQFPYCQSDAISPKKSKDKLKLLEINTDTKCMQENLLACYLFSLLYRKLPEAHCVNKANIVLDFIMKCLVNRNFVPPENIKSLTLVLKSILLTNSVCWNEKGLNLSKILEGTVHFYQRSTLPDHIKADILDILCQLIDHPHFKSEPSFEEWLSTLPTLLIRNEISSQIVDVLSTLVRKNNPLVQKSITTNLAAILDNLPRLKITGTADLKESQIKITSLFLYNPAISSSDLKIFLCNYPKNTYSVYFKQLLMYKNISF